MELRLLGPVELWVAGREFLLGRPRQRCVLAVLAAAAGRPVGMDELLARVWGDRSPAGARDVLYTYVSRLRQALALAGVRDVLRRSGRGYLLDVDPAVVDLHRSRRLAAEARALSDGDDERAAGLWDAAADLWRGVPLAGLDGDWVARTRTTLDQERLAILTEKHAVWLRLGRHGEVVGPLTDLVADHPLDETLTGLLMLALHQSGRQADALATYVELRRRLVDEIGDEPGDQVRQLHERILCRDLTLDATTSAAARRDQLARPAQSPATAAGEVSGGLAVRVPAQLPSDVSAFVGRGEQLARLGALVGAGAGRSMAVVISAIAGTAGVGKTALAVHWAHQVRERFPDGQLYVNLRGYDPDQPMAAGDVLARFLVALGVPDKDVPFEVDERAARYRTQTVGRRMLVVLDNAANVEQVRPLLPGTPSCPVVVTSRDSLAGLVAVHGAHRIDLDLLPPDDATALLRVLIGARVDADPDAAQALVELCARLPLALRVAAELAISRPSIPLADLVTELADQQRRLDLLDAGGDTRAAVAGVFSWSIRHLPAEVARTFRRLGIHPGADLDPYAVAALTDTDMGPVRQVLNVLARAHLIHATNPGRYGMHDLLRAYAIQLTDQEDSVADRTAAVGRLLDYYRHTAALAMDVAYPDEREYRPQVPLASTPCPDLPDLAPALAWLDTELLNLLAAAKWATEHGQPEHVLHLSRILHWHLRGRCRYHDAETLHQQALATARATGHHAGVLDATNELGHIIRLQGRYTQAVDHFQRASQLARAIGHRTGEMDALFGLGQIHWVQGRYTQAADHLQRALRHARAAGHRTGEMNTLISLGRVRRLQGRHTQAAGHYQQALRIARATDHRTGGWGALAGLGHIDLLQGQHARAGDHFHEVLQIARATGDRHAEMDALFGLGLAHRLQGRHAQAADRYQQLLDVAHESDNRNWQFEAHQGLGRLRHASGDPDTAITHHDQALALADELGHPGDQARAHDGLAHAHHALNQHDQAREHWQHALTILTSHDIEHTDDEETNITTIRTHLATVLPP